MGGTGRATPVGTAGDVLETATTAPSATFIATVGPDGLAGAWRPTDGDEATFAFEVTFTGKTSFQEIVPIAFGAGHRLLRHRR